MTVFTNRSFNFGDVRDLATTFEDIEFRECAFGRCIISSGPYPEDRTTLRNIKLINCKAWGSVPYDVNIEDCLVDNFRYDSDELSFRGVLFRRTVLRGQIRGDFTIREFNHDDRPEIVDEWYETFHAYYNAVDDWALDISEGEFEKLRLPGIPGHLVKRDPETQVLLDRARLYYHDGNLDEFGRAGAAARYLLTSKVLTSMVFVAPKLGNDFRERLDEIALLRKAGLVVED